MNSKTTHIRFGSTLIAAASTAALGSAAFATIDDEGSKTERHIVISVDDSDQSSSRSQSVAVQNIDGKITVKVNGEEIPVDRIKHEDGRVIILDEDGTEMALGNIWIGGDDDEHGIMPWVMRFHDAEGNDELAGSMRQFFDEDFEFDFDGNSFEPPKVMLGVQLAPPGAALEIHLRLDPDSATMISRVYEGLAADEAGLEKYDIIVAINGDTPADHGSIRAVLSDQEPGDEITLTIIHEGKKRKVNVQLQEYKAEQLHELQLGEGGTFLLPLDREGEGLRFRFRGDTKDLHKLLIDPERGRWFIPLEMEGGKHNRHLNRELLEELHKQLGDDAAEEIHERLKGRLPGVWRERLHGEGEDVLKLHRRLERGDDDARTKALNDRIEELKRMLDKLVEEAAEIDDDEI